MSDSERPQVVEFWAPWCVPCRQMAPILQRVAERYAGRVELTKINVDEQPEQARAYGVMAVPALVVLRQGQVILRRTGALDEVGLEAVFAAAEQGSAAALPVLRPFDRLLRSGAGALLLGASVLVSQAGWVLALLGAALLFSAVYDRCPVYRAVRSALTQRRKAKQRDWQSTNSRQRSEDE